MPRGAAPRPASSLLLTLMLLQAWAGPGLLAFQHAGLPASYDHVPAMLLVLQVSVPEQLQA